VAAPAPVLAQDSNPNPGDLEALGKALFFDPDLSVNGQVSCATCHAAEVGFTGPDSAINQAGSVYMGAIPGRFGNRRPPTAAYAGESPVLYFNETEGEWIGGMFYDGRATGATLGDPLAEQAGGPFLNPLEHAFPEPRTVIARVQISEYANLFEQVWGEGSLDIGQSADATYERIMRSIAAYERSAEVSPFSSKFDAFWNAATAAGKDVTLIRFGNMRDPYRWQAYAGYGLNQDELMGLAAFNSRAGCSTCHSLQPGEQGYPLFTDFSYHNLGLPKNSDNPFYQMQRKWNPDGKNWIDPGLGGYLQSAGYAPEVYTVEMGKFKTPTLRNVDLRPTADFVKAYGHNGYFKSLDDIVMFYEWRAMMDGGCMGGGGSMGGGMGGGGMGGGGMGGGGMGCGGMGGMMEDMFPAPELDANRAQLNMFNMMDRQNIVAFLKTLSDGFIQ
jgi:cytochrome c peroxidase